MSEWRDPAIKLFGTEIPLPEEKMLAEVGDDDVLAPAIGLPLEGEKDSCKEKSKDENAMPVMVDTEETPSSSDLNNSAKNDKKTSSETAKLAEEPNPENQHKEANSSGEDKALKKPDKVLPCPRCDSVDTKFCYYNNYNVNQPRHFCKNCQRYWTAGGTMRNVPVGAGRRKNKHSASSYRHTVVTPDALTSVQTDGHDVNISSSKRSLNGNSTILQFGPDAPFCESMASMLNIGEQKTENGEETSCSSSSVAASNPVENGLPSPHWPYPWNPGCNSGQENFILPSPMITVPAFCAPTFPFPLIPASFWGWSGGPWNLPWAGNGNGASSPPSSTATNNCSEHCSLILGKHSREAEKSLWIPKTLRIDDPEEAAKSSFFATLGIKFDECEKFKNFRSNAGRDAVKLLRSNPAALSRSQSFQEAA